MKKAFSKPTMTEVSTRNSIVSNKSAECSGASAHIVAQTKE